MATAAPATPAAGPPAPPAPPRRSRTLLSLAAALIALPVLAGLLMRGDLRNPPFQDIDSTWLRWMGGPHDGIPEALAMALNWFGGPFGAPVQLLAVIVLLALRRRRSALFVLAAVFFGQLVIQGLKNVVDRPRPANPLITVDHGSFPSGHVATMAMVVIVIGVLCVPGAARRRWWWPVATLLVLAMMWSRTWLHAHWLSDTAAGAVAGAGATLLVWWAFAPLLAKEKAARAASPQSL
ncbi:phosphatase PAP2 family protein [Streptomyces sp. NPDC051561]|uniref:phosphatase PAP2 family protein n=1 Tax=Streptomyces sp. NPDC051561 TaxID=3365658 RepID=UPI0037AAC89A